MGGDLKLVSSEPGCTIFSFKILVKIESNIEKENASMFSRSIYGRKEMTKNTEYIKLVGNVKRDIPP